MNSFWYVVKDNDNMTFDVKGLISNDDPYNGIICDAQRNGFEVNCATAPGTASEEEVCREFEGYGFKRDRDLFSKVNLVGRKGSSPIV